MLILLSLLRTLLFFLTMMIGSVLLHQSLYGDATTPQLAELLYAGIFIVTPLYLVFDFLGGRITQSKRFRTFVWPFLIGLVVALFFAYSATRLS